ncbi:hypothetical protein FXV83_16120 [Bradyrhizobium hipponense]|uniref:Uncharacterized protein n=1 Tax=Bradyrhizobium hipponense TaxID=2605638 RepID=A0A5S4YM72_9BRAD|nr:hypothetical protein [Bradyrhizobium hipponense]TYO65460.1 hypothetical protein FXV83_16120 [Bradyrhizobium hipponense]
MSDDHRIVLSAPALRITAGEHRALLEIRDLFAKGVFKHDPALEADKPDGFNMDQAETETSCGTTCCIGGWVWAAMSRDRTTSSPTAGRYVTHDRSFALRALYYPDQNEIQDMAYSDITPGAALCAIDSFLATGDPDWYRACGFHLVEDQLA